MHMATKTTVQNSIIAFAIPFSIIFLMVLIAGSKLFQSNPDMLSIAITIDLLFTVPFLYFLLIRKKNISKLTIVYFFIIGLIVSSFIIPKEHQSILQFVKNWILPFIEIGIVVLVLTKIRKGIKIFKSNTHKEVSIDFFTVLKDTCAEILPKKISIFLAMEIAVVYYGFIYWKKRLFQPNEYSYHKNSGTISLLVALIFIIGIETFVLHILLLKWNVIIAWVVTGLSIYSGVQIFGFLKSFYKRPITIENDKLYLRYGIMSETEIAISNIDTITISSREIDFDKTNIKLSPLGALESHNIVITLKNEEVLNGLYGIKKEYQTIALYVDDKERFTTEIENQLPQK